MAIIDNSSCKHSVPWQWLMAAFGCLLMAWLCHRFCHETLLRLTFSTLLSLGAAYFGFSCLAKYLNLEQAGQGNQQNKLTHYQKCQSSLKERLNDGINMTREYYDMVTDWYEIGWGQSFQLGGAQGMPGESLAERCRRHDFWSANRAGIKKGEKWLDLGCGVGGPLRNIVRFTEANIKGVNSSSYQLQKAERYAREEGLEDYCSFLHCDFSRLTEHVKLNAYDGAYALEAICHAPDKLKVYTEIFKSLKPGGTFFFFEWAMTDKFDPNNAIHVEAKRGIEVLGGIADLETTATLVSKVTKAGFDVEDIGDFNDLEKFYPESWYSKFDPSASLFNFPTSKPGVAILQFMLRIWEFLRIVEKGSAEAHRTMTSGIPGTLLSGKLGIFTPHFYCVARKPLN